MADHLPGDQIKLRVGEKYYNASRKTLENSNEFKNKILKSRRNEYFLDRDGELFDYIIKYLRTGTIQFPDGFQQSEDLKKEAAYFKLDHLKEALESGAGTIQVVKLLVPPTKEERKQFNPPIYEIMPVGWTWDDLVNLLPPVKDAMIETASITLSNANGEFGFSFKGGGNYSDRSTPTALAYLSKMVNFMPVGGLQIKILDPVKKTAVLDKLMTEHGFKIMEPTSDPAVQVVENTEEFILSRIKPVITEN